MKKYKLNMTFFYNADDKGGVNLKKVSFKDEDDVLKKKKFTAISMKGYLDTKTMYEDQMSITCIVNEGKVFYRNGVKKVVKSIKDAMQYATSEAHNKLITQLIGVYA